MNYDDLQLNFDELMSRVDIAVSNSTNPLEITNLNNELRYVKNLMEKRDITETTFTEGNDGTVNISGPSGTTNVQGVDFVKEVDDLLPDVLDAFDDSFDTEWQDIERRLNKLKKFSKDRLTAQKKRDFENQVERVQAVTRVIQAKEKINLNPRNRNVRELIKRSSVRTLSDGIEVLMFKSEKGIDGSGTQIMKRGKTSIPVYSKNSPALREYRELIRKIKHDQTTDTEPEQAVDINEVSGQNSFISEVSEFENIELVNIEQQTDTDISGLTQEENRELRGVIKPKESVLWSSRIGENGALQKQVDHFNETIYETIEMRDQADDIEEYRRLDSRVEALRKARDKTAFQRELEEVRFKQVEDISRFKRFKDWLGENKVSLTGIAVSTAALITTLIVGTRGAIIGAAKATGKVAKALANLARKGAPILIPVLNALATALSWGAKGITWLASNLWVLAIAAALLTYDYLQR
ncbi:Hypothetical predicted protein [Paramuricea clavata]|uniref:Uncharacterized protein n=1 Tax=Paramuricea clavata TaxID=317549 RepID=A0A7D9J9F5_PARCT|nr:Hypothetical predicted protein [Paramuricea clavata]